MALSALYFVHLPLSSPSSPNPTKHGPTGGRGGALRKFNSMRNPCDLFVNKVWNFDVSSTAVVEGGGGGFGLDLDVDLDDDDE